jgi:hypothetical protein
MQLAARALKPWKSEHALQIGDYFAVYLAVPDYHKI